MTVNETDSKVLVKGHDQFALLESPGGTHGRRCRRSRPAGGRNRAGLVKATPGNAAPHGSKGGRGLSADTRWVACGAGNVATFPAIN